MLDSLESIDYQDSGQGGKLMIRVEGTKAAKVIAVIETKALRGSGTKEDPTREITQYWDLNGHFLAEIDEVQRMHLIEYDSESVTSDC